MTIWNQNILKEVYNLMMEQDVEIDHTHDNLIAI